MLGHASIQQTQRYLNATDEELRKGLEVSWLNQADHYSGVGAMNRSRFSDGLSLYCLRRLEEVAHRAGRLSQLAHPCSLGIIRESVDSACDMPRSVCAGISAVQSSSGSVHHGRFSLVSQSHHGIHPCRPPRRKIACGQRDNCEQGWRGRERQRVPRSRSKKQRRDQPHQAC